MLRLSTGQRALIADKLADAANLGLGGLVVGQFLGDRAYSVPVAAGGLVFWFTFIGAAVVFRGKNGDA